MGCTSQTSQVITLIISAPQLPQHILLTGQRFCCLVDVPDPLLGVLPDYKSLGSSCFLTPIRSLSQIPQIFTELCFYIVPKMLEILLIFLSTLSLGPSHSLPDPSCFNPYLTLRQLTKIYSISLTRRIHVSLLKPCLLLSVNCSTIILY